MDAPTAAKLAEAQAGMSSRFESQSTIDEAKSNREKEWKEAYARWVPIPRCILNDQDRARTA
jgi:hypothetical protein